MQEEKIVITGATGNIGQKLLAALSGKNIIGTSRTVSDEMQNIRKINNFSQLPKGNVLIHLAEENNQEKANSLKKKHVQETTNNMDQILQIGFEHVIYASSAYVYSDTKIHKRTEYENTEPYDYYTEAKLINEEKTLNAKGSVARIANVISDIKQDGVIKDIITLFDQSSKIEVNDGSPVRDFIFIQDVISCFDKMSQKKTEGIFNIATGFGIAIHQLARLIGRLMHQKEVEVLSKNKKENRRSTLILDIEKTKQEFDWLPVVNIEQGLRTLLEGYK